MATSPPAKDQLSMSRTAELPMYAREPTASWESRWADVSGRQQTKDDEEERKNKDALWWYLNGL